MRVQAEPPIPPHKQFGANVAAWVAYHRMLGLSMTKVLASLEETYGLVMSEASGYELEAWVAQALGPKYQELQRLVKDAEVVHGDETKFRVGGANGWLWVFSTLLGTLYVVHPSRGQDVPKDALRGFEGALVTDAWDAYDAAGVADRQLDLLHVNRWLERVEVQRGVEPRSLVKQQPARFTRPGRPSREFLRFADGVRSRLRLAIAFAEAKPLLRARKRAYAHHRVGLLGFLRQPWKDPDARRIAKELRLRLDMVFTFVRLPGVPWHNNDAERAIRQGVLHRKISGGRRTWEGAKRFEVLLSVFETCKKTGENFLALARKLLLGQAYAGLAIRSSQPQT
jgi:transposase